MGCADPPVNIYGQPQQEHLQVPAFFIAYLFNVYAAPIDTF